MVKEKWSKKAVAKFCDEIRESHIKVNGFDTKDGTHQFLKDFTDQNVSDAIAVLRVFQGKERVKDENWDLLMDAEKTIYDLMSKIVSYGIKQAMDCIIINYDLNKELI